MGPDPGALPIPGAWRATIIIFCAIILCVADQLLPGLFMAPIKASFGVSDTQIALLTGFSFSVSIAVFALPLSWVADRSNRARLLAGAILCWCLATVACGFAHGFWTFFVLRMGVGLGEAVLKPAAYSLLADLFPSRLLSRPLAILGLGTLLGSVVALNGGGALYEVLRAAVPHGGAGTDFAWRTTMIIFGATGLLVAVAAFWIPEPRANRSPVVSTTESRASVPLVAYARSSAFFYVPFVAAMCVYCFYYAGFSAWQAPFFALRYGWSIGRIGQVLGLVALSAGVIGMPLGVWLTDQARRRYGREAPVAAVNWAIGITLPAIILTPFAPDGWLAVMGMALVLVPGSAATIIAPIIFAETAPSHLRARVMAIAALFYGLLGTGVGPVAYGAFTDHVLRDSTKLPITLSVLSGASIAVFIPLMMLAERRFAAVIELARSSSQNGGAP